jgi:hypothetical protein
MTDDELTREEHDRFARARVPVTPPAGLEDRTVRALRERGLVRRPRPWSSAIAAVAAAAAILLAVGWGVMRTAAPGGPPAAGSRFVLLLYAGVDPPAGAADTRRQEYAAWARDLSSRGVAITGEELAEDAREIGGGAASPPGLLPRGFFVLGAESLDAAERIAATCPHLRYGGRIAVKRVVP